MFISAEQKIIKPYFQLYEIIGPAGNFWERRHCGRNVGGVITS